MAVKLRLLCLLVFILCGCAVSRTTPTIRIALLAPFEGRYREIGYNAYYAVQLAFNDAGVNGVEFLPIDDGGSAERAVERARAFALDPQVRLVLVLGYASTATETLDAFGDVPVIIIGYWGAQPDGAFILASQELDTLLTVPPRIEVTLAARESTPLVGGEIFALTQFPALREDLNGITIISSATLPDDDFATRYAAVGPFVPAPNLLATLTYDAANLALQAAAGERSRSEVRAALEAIYYEGVNGTIQFDSEGYWIDAPIYRYQYVDDQLTLIP
jgi:ABC-type branched-subunit amino acid transport system substrate-binding protein